MTTGQFITEALRTESVDYDAIIQRLQNKSTIRILHAALGCVTEGGELADALKKHIFYGKQLDVVNVKEEMGDLMWYFAILCDEFQILPEDVMETVIEKLRIRYPEKFSEHHATNRDLSAERALLEQKF